MVNPMARPMWVIRMIMRAFPQRFFLAKMTNVPLIGDIIDGMLFEGDDIIYLPSDKAIELNKSFDMPTQTVLPSQVVEHFIEKANYHWVMNWCICRNSTKCKDYPINLGCLFLGEAAMKIDPRLGHPVTKQEALEHVRRCREAGLVHLIGRNKLDAVWLDVSPGNKLLSICNCCPCCCLWKILPHLANSICSKVTKMPGVDVSVTDLCDGCGICAKGICFVDAIKMIDGQAVIGQECRGCGRCIRTCPINAIRISIDDKNFYKKSIARISSAVDVA